MTVNQNWNHGLRLWLTLLLFIETIERIALSKTNKKKTITYLAYVSHIHTQSVTYILVFEAMDPD